MLIIFSKLMIELVNIDLIRIETFLHFSDLSAERCTRCFDFMNTLLLRMEASIGLAHHI